MPDDPETPDPDGAEDRSEDGSREESSSNAETDGREMSNVSLTNKWSKLSTGKRLALFLATGVGIGCILYLVFILFALWGLLNFPP